MSENWKVLHYKSLMVYMQEATSNKFAAEIPLLNAPKPNMRYQMSLPQLSTWSQK
jgi:hypothetical protein